MRLRYSDYSFPPLTSVMECLTTCFRPTSVGGGSGTDDAICLPASASPIHPKHNDQVRGQAGVSERPGRATRCPPVAWLRAASFQFSVCHLEPVNKARVPHCRTTNPPYDTKIPTRSQQFLSESEQRGKRVSSRAKQYVIVAEMSAAAGEVPSIQERVKALAPCNSYVAAWSALFFFCRFVLFRRYSADFANRCVSIVHALVAIALSAAAVNWADPMGNVGGPNTPEQASGSTLSFPHLHPHLFFRRRLRCNKCYYGCCVKALLRCPHVCTTCMHNSCSRCIRGRSADVLHGCERVIFHLRLHLLPLHRVGHGASMHLFSMFLFTFQQARFGAYVD